MRNSLVPGWPQRPLCSPTPPTAAVHRLSGSLCLPLTWPLASPITRCLLLEAFRLVLLKSKSSIFWVSFLAGREQQGPSWPWSGSVPKLEYLQAGGPRELQALLEDRIHNYREAAASAKESGEAAKTRRCERGLKVGWAQPGARLGGVGLRAAGRAAGNAAGGWASRRRPPHWPGGCEGSLTCL